MDERALAATVAEQANLTKEESADLIRATLEQLGSQVSSGEIRGLALELPGGLASHLPQHNHRAHPVSLPDFIHRLSRRTGLNEAEVTRGVRAILTTLGRAPGGSQLRQALAQLPAEYRQLTTT
jgi:uncharacterized protein (DUF2267 family)